MDSSKDSSENTHVIYLSGAGLNPVIWDDVCAKVTTPGTAIAHGREPATTLSSAVQDVLAQIQKLDARRYVIVAHSLSGVIGVEVARALGDKLDGFIAVTATIPSLGGSFTSALPFPQNLLMPLLLRIVGTKPPAAAIRSGLCSDLNDQQAAAIVDAFAPEPRSLYVDKTSTSQLPVSKYLYVRTLDDKEIPASHQATMAKRLPGGVVVDIAGGHMVMISHPDELATIINQFIATLSPDR